jgi:deoxyribodipyrimidine photo-lyase
MWQWQWAAGTGCDATPYFRVFNPSIQLKKFDEKGVYIRQWIPEFELGYGKPMVDHAFAREELLQRIRQA